MEDQESEAVAWRQRHRARWESLRATDGLDDGTMEAEEVDLVRDTLAEMSVYGREEVEVLEGRVGAAVEDWHERVAWGLVEADGEELLIADRSDEEDGAEETKEGGGGLRILEAPRKPCYFQLLSEDLVFAVLRYLESDMYGVLSCVSVALARTAVDDTLFQELCGTTYAVQTRWGRARVERWGSWRDMWLRRPRLRVNGLYFQRVSYIKKPERNMWFQGEVGEILECVYYRYLRFFPTGEVLYGISLHPPKKAAALLGSPAQEHKDVNRGLFEVLPDHRARVIVTAEQGRLELDLDVSNGERGHFTRLLLKHHRQYPHASLTGEPRDLPILANVFKFRRMPIRTKPKGVW